MWFSGKRFRRTRCENIDKLLAATNVNEEIVRMLKTKAPVVCYTAIGNNSIKLDLDVDGKHTLSHVFKLGEEEEMEKKDGNKVKMTYSLEGENILKQVIKMHDGKKACFVREFMDKDVKMTVTMDGTDVSATIYYEIVQ
ncbi:fatty acid-binding protein-like [Maniola jurtina]|uniref:fatty acid-binding protein-like n=1 Tax=Maniola jurtina TaxID=191418 RepID=UPI001E68905D|nr:fatty acid-binding protein-like [Maniola jurtina]